MVGLLVSLITLPMMLLNFFGGIAALIWLAILGDWSTLGAAILSILVGAAGCSLLLMPGILLFGLPAGLLIERGGVSSIAGFFLGGLAVIYTQAAMAVWAIGAYWYFVEFMPYGAPQTPYLLATYSVATAPWTYMASKELNNEYAGMSAAFLQISCAIALILLLLGIAESVALTAFVCVLVLGLAAQLLTAATMNRGVYR